MKKNTLKNIKPIIKMDENESMPLYMFIGDTECPYLRNTKMNFMTTAMHMKKENIIKVIGRIRYEYTERKTIFEIKEQFKMTELLEVKGKIQEMYNTMCEKMQLKEIHKPQEIEFMINEDIDSILKKMNESNAFNMEKIKS